MRETHLPPLQADETPADNVSDLFLERYLLDELKAEEKARFAQRLAGDPVLRERLESLRRDNEDFARSYDPGTLAHGARERARTAEVHARLKADAARTRSRRLPGFAGWKPALGGLFVLALVAVPAWRVLNGESSTMVRPEVPAKVPATISEANDGQTDPRGSGTPDHSEIAPESDNSRVASATPPRITETPTDAPSVAVARAEEEVTRLKGLEPALALFRRTRTGAEPLKPGASVKPGDVVRIGYRSAGLSFGAIFSVDGHGNVTRHWPLSGDRAARLEAGEALLPGAFELDDAPSYERFYLLTAERAFDLKPLLESLHAAKAPAEPGVTVFRFELLKENGI